MVNPINYTVVCNKRAVFMRKHQHVSSGKMGSRSAWTWSKKSQDKKVSWDAVQGRRFFILVAVVLHASFPQRQKNTNAKNVIGMMNFYIWAVEVSMPNELDLLRYHFILPNINLVGKQMLSMSAKQLDPLRYHFISPNINLVGKQMLSMSAKQANCY